MNIFLLGFVTFGFETCYFFSYFFFDGEKFLIVLEKGNLLLTELC